MWEMAGGNVPAAQVIDLRIHQPESSADSWFGEDGVIAIVKRVFRDGFSRDLFWVYLFAIAAMVLVAAMTALSAWLMQSVVNDIFVSQDNTMIVALGFTVIAVFTLKGLGTYGSTIAMERIANAITRDFQIRMMHKITTLSVDYFERNHSSRLIMRISRNAAAVAQIVVLVSTSLGRNLLTLIGLAAVMIIQDPLMSAIVFLVIPVLVFGLRRLGAKMKELDSEEFSSMAAVIASTQETLSGIKIVKAFGLEDMMRGKVRKAAIGAEMRHNAIARIKAAVSPLTETGGGVAIGAVIMYAGWQTVSQGKTPGEFMAFLTAFLLAYEPAKRLAGFHVSLQRSANQARMFYKLLDDPGVETDKPDAIALSRPEGRVEFCDVSFSYRKKNKVLKGITFNAEPDTVTALVGHSGAGKSTIFNLIQRFYAPTEGQILVDGIDIADLTRESWRSNMAYVSQDTFLFSGSIYENIACGKPEANEDDVRAAADAALVTEFTETTSDGLDTQVGEGGMLLSGGQRQRVAIARAILKDTPILLLDEATSALDNQSEQLIRQAIASLTKGRTTIVIAHRLSTIRSADQIFMIRNGKIVESGRHEDLMQVGGAYERLYRSDELV